MWAQGQGYGHNCWATKAVYLPTCISSNTRWIQHTMSHLRKTITMMYRQYIICFVSYLQVFWNPFNEWVYKLDWLSEKGLQVSTCYMTLFERYLCDSATQAWTLAEQSSSRLAPLQSLFSNTTNESALHLLSISLTTLSRNRCRLFIPQWTKQTNKNQREAGTADKYECHFWSWCHVCGDMDC